MLEFTRLMLISSQVEVVVEVGVELGKIRRTLAHCLQSQAPANIGICQEMQDTAGQSRILN